MRIGDSLWTPPADDQQKPAVGDKRVHSEMSADNVRTMVSVTKQLEDICVSQRVEDLDKLTSGKVTLHKDSITLGADIQGIDNLKKYYQVHYWPHNILTSCPAVTHIIKRFCRLSSKSTTISTRCYV